MDARNGATHILIAAECLARAAGGSPFSSRSNVPQSGLNSRIQPGKEADAMVQLARHVAGCVVPTANVATQAFQAPLDAMAGHSHSAAFIYNKPKSGAKRVAGAMPPRAIP